MTPHKLDTSTQVFFYEQEFYCLSNFSSFRLKWRGIDFDTSEHAYQWTKFNYPGANNEVGRIADSIFKARSAHDAFKIAERNKPLVYPAWDQIKIETMRQILIAKVEQHEYVRRKLLETGDRELIEDSWRDPFWGWGEGKKGQNVLGHLWMSVRDTLRPRSLQILELHFQAAGWHIEYADGKAWAWRPADGSKDDIRIDLSKIAQQIGEGR